MPTTIDRLELRELHMPMKSSFETSFGVTNTRRVVLAKVFAGDAWGIGELACGEEPGYNHESTDMAWILMTHFLAPMLLGKPLHHPSDVDALFKSVRGNHFAKGAIGMAVYDLFAKLENQPLWRYLGGVQTHLPVGLSVGIKASPEALADFVLEQQSHGYRRIKLKIAPGRDVAFANAARAALGATTALTVDANSAYTLDDTPALQALDEVGLEYIEQPLAYDDLIDHATLAQRLRTPLCLDEPIHSVDDVRKAHQIGAGRIINLKLGRVGGYAQALKIAAYCHDNKIGLWCGGMLESGVGRAHNVALQTLAGFTSASDTAPSWRYWHEDIIEPEITMTDDGFTAPLDGPGIGVALREDLIHGLTVRVESLQ